MEFKCGRLKHTPVWEIFAYVTFFCVMFYIAYELPYCHDEWKWRLDAGVSLMKKGFGNYNGRYPIFLPWLLQEVSGTLLLTSLLLIKGQRGFLAMEITAVPGGCVVYGVWHRLNPSWVFVGNEMIHLFIEAVMGIVFFVHVIVCLRP